MNYTVLLGSDFIDMVVILNPFRTECNECSITLSNSLFDSNYAATRRFEDSFLSSGNGVLE